MGKSLKGSAYAMAAWTLVLLATGGCVSLNSPAVRQVAQQNQLNAQLLDANAKTLMGLVETLCVAQGEALLDSQIATTFVEVNSLVGGLVPPLPTDQWSTYLTGDPRWKSLAALDGQGLLSSERIESLRQGSGWVMTAYLQEKQGGPCSPCYAYGLTRQTLDLRNNVLLNDAEKRSIKVSLWRDFDPELACYEKMLQESDQVLRVMRDSIKQQTANSDEFSRRLLEATQAKTDVAATLGGIVESDEFGILLDKVVKTGETQEGESPGESVDRKQLATQFLVNLLKKKIAGLASQ